MKQKILYIFFLLIFLCCNNDNETSESQPYILNKILFNAEINTIIQSKSIINEESFPSNSSIGIYAWGHILNSTESNIRKDLNNTPYSKSLDNGDFTCSNHAHYPINPDTLLNFYAYYPYTEAATATPLSIPFDLKKQDDIMWATPVLDQDKSTADQKVNLSFNHILSAITLIFKKADDIKEDMILQSISMENYPATIQLNIQTGELTGPASSSPFTVIENLQTAITQNETAIVTDYLLYPIDKPVFIVKLSGKDYRIESTKAFAKGKKQTYTFTIQATDISLSGSIAPWQDGGSNEETVYF